MPTIRQFSWRAALTRNRTLVVGKRIESELVGEVDCPTPVAKPAKHLTVGIDGAFVKAKPNQAGGRPFEILTGRVERSEVEATPLRLSGTLIHGRSRKYKPFSDDVAAVPRLNSLCCPMAKTDYVESSAGLAKTAVTCWTGSMYGGALRRLRVNCCICRIVRILVAFYPVIRRT
jgi:hypothetical protein